LPELGSVKQSDGKIVTASAFEADCDPGAVDQQYVQMIDFARFHGLEGVVAKRADSVYQPGKRTGYWTKTRINLAQEFVIGGYIRSNPGIDSIVIGFYRGKDLYYAARVGASW